MTNKNKIRMICQFVIFILLGELKFAIVLGVDIRPRREADAAKLHEEDRARSLEWQTLHRHDRKTLSEARSRLYQRQFWQPNSHFGAFFEIYKICNPLHRSKFSRFLQSLNCFAKFCKKIELVCKILLNFFKNCHFSFGFSRNVAGISKNISN